MLINCTNLVQILGNVWLHYFVLDTYDCGNTILPANAQAAAIVGEAR